MKVTNWRRKLTASLVAGGLYIPCVGFAADLNTNLVVDPSFENTDPNPPFGPFMSRKLLDWPDSGLDGNVNDDNWAYRFDMNYAGVNTPAGAGTQYFSGGFNTTAGQVTLAQSVSVSTGASGTLISTGQGAFQMSGFFSSYLDQADASAFRVRFLNVGGTELGRSSVGGLGFVQSLGFQEGEFGDHRDWGQDSLSGVIPAGTATVALEVVSEGAAANHDGYTDLLDFQIISAETQLAFLEVNRTNGQVRLRNETGDPIDIDYYEIISPNNANALNPTAWNSLQEQNLPGFKPGTGTGDGWEQAGGSSSSVVSESYLTDGSTLADGDPVGLGAAFNVGGAETLIFRYGKLPPEAAIEPGDYNGNGAVELGDFNLVVANWGDAVPPIPGPWSGDPPTSPQVDLDDFNKVVANWGSEADPRGPSVLTTGVVRYVNSFQDLALGTTVPEPTGIILVGVGLGIFAAAARRRDT